MFSITHAFIKGFYKCSNTYFSYCTFIAYTVHIFIVHIARQFETLWLFLTNSDFSSSRIQCLTFPGLNAFSAVGKDFSWIINSNKW